MTVLTQIPTTLDDSVLEWQQDLLVAGNSMTGNLASGLPSWIDSSLSNSTNNLQGQSLSQYSNGQNLNQQSLNTPVQSAIAPGTFIVTSPNTFPAGTVITGGGGLYVSGNSLWQTIQPVPPTPIGPYLRMQFHYILDTIEDSGPTKVAYSDRAIRVRDRRQFDNETCEVDLVGFVDILLANGHSASTINHYVTDVESRLGIKFVDQD